MPQIRIAGAVAAELADTAPVTRHAYGLFVAVLGVAFLALGLSVRTFSGAVAAVFTILMFWSAAVAIAVALAYFVNAPGIFAKARTNGILPWWARVLWFPYFALVSAVCGALRLRTQSAAHEVAPGIFVGRLPSNGVPAGVTLVIDLCAEFSNVTRDTAYLTIPTLDGCAADPDDVKSAIAVARQYKSVLVHCAAGHGRSATIAALIAVDRGLFASGDQAILAFQQLRPGIAPTPDQRLLLRQGLRVDRTREG